MRQDQQNGLRRRFVTCRSTDLVHKGSARDGALVFLVRSMTISLGLSVANQASNVASQGIASSLFGSAQAIVEYAEVRPRNTVTPRLTAPDRLRA